MIKTDLSPSLPLYYAEKLYNDEDVLEENAKASKNTDDEQEVRLSTFEKGLLELGDADEVAKIIGKKLKKQQQQEQQKLNKVTKPKKTKSISK